jgi:hypothetical protein
MIHIVKPCFNLPFNWDSPMFFNTEPIALLAFNLAVPFTSLLSPADPGVVNTLVEMGFTQARVETALRRVGINSVEAAMEWLLTHPEDPAPAQPAAAAGQ